MIEKSLLFSFSLRLLGSETLHFFSIHLLIKFSLTLWNIISQLFFLLQLFLLEKLWQQFVLRKVLTPSNLQKSFSSLPINSSPTIDLILFREMACTIEWQTRIPTSGTTHTSIWTRRKGTESFPFWVVGNFFWIHWVWPSNSVDDCPEWVVSKLFRHKARYLNFHCTPLHLLELKSVFTVLMHLWLMKRKLKKPLVVLLQLSNMNHKLRKKWKIWTWFF